MRRQRRSITDIICENCKYLPTKRSRNKRKPIPKESDVKTFNYTAHLWDIRWLTALLHPRYRSRRHRLPVRQRYVGNW
ncbi:NinE family protein [Escherichia coli]|nr:NinE family protein [Escherichia coli]MCZ5190996.1 NinE family protein [Escherichia coli]MCZ5616169.1 NinE family protein [Escherichia coli]MCZ5624193.1 NinE family protein [Escherichia coli]MCZ5763809.1 NinE family protein [Escherichia coli]